MNGQAFLARARRAARPAAARRRVAGRRTASVGDEAVPADLRVDHVYLVSCKYLSRIVVNASPQHLFDRLLAGGHGQRSGGDWFDEVAPDEHAALYATVRDAVDTRAARRRRPTLSAEQRRALAHSFERGSAWPGDGDALLRGAGRARRGRVGAALARRRSAPKAESMLWRLLRIGSAPYFVLGASPKGFTALADRHTVGLAPALRAPRASTSRRAPAGSRWSRGTRSCAGAPTATETRGARARRDPLEPRALLRPARGEGVPRHPARRGARLLRARLARDRQTAAHAATSAGSDASTRARNSSSRAGSPSSSQCSSASNTNDTSVSAAHRLRTRAGACARA